MVAPVRSQLSPCSLFLSADLTILGIGQECLSETECPNSIVLSTHVYKSTVFSERSTSYASVRTYTSPPQPRGRGVGQRGESDHGPDPRGGLALRPAWLASRYLLVPWSGAGAAAAGPHTRPPAPPRAGAGFRLPHWDTPPGSGPPSGALASRGEQPARAGCPGRGRRFLPGRNGRDGACALLRIPRRRTDQGTQKLSAATFI